MTFQVRLTRDAEADLARLFDFILERELTRDGGDLILPEQAMAALRAGIATLRTSPFTCRKAGRSPFLRELIIPFGRSGYVALFEIEDASQVTVLPCATNLKTTITELQSASTSLAALRSVAWVSNRSAVLRPSTEPATGTSISESQDVVQPHLAAAAVVPCVSHRSNVQWRLSGIGLQGRAPPLTVPTA